MPRRARIYQKSICYHVLNRGINRNPIFIDDKDREMFLHTIKKYKHACDAHVYHWVLMGNHFHLLIDVAFENLRPFVGGIQQSYAQYHHKMHQTCGTFWQGRFKSKPVEIGSYLLSCGRYIERNPVRAGLAELAWDYPWSSAAFYVEEKTDLITDQNIYLGTFTKRDRAHYADALTAGKDDELIRNNETRKTIGSPEFSNSFKTEQGHMRLKKGRPRKTVTVCE